MVNAKIKKILVSNSLTGPVYGCLLRLYVRYVFYLRCRRLRKVGPYVLRRVHEALAGAGLSYCACGGTLLGIVRDRGFIKHDDDVDYMVPPSDFDPYDYFKALDAVREFKFVRAFEWRGRIQQLVFAYCGMEFDFFFMYREHDKLFLQWYQDGSGVGREWQPVRIEEKGFSGVKLITFKGCNVPIPVNAEEVLSTSYGNWRVPVKGFHGEDVSVVDYGQARRELLDEVVHVVGHERVKELARSGGKGA